MTDDDIIMCVEEIAMDGKILFGTKYLKTAKRTIERMNYYLELNQYDWRVDLYKDETLRFPYGAKIKEDAEYDDSKRP